MQHSPAAPSSIIGFRLTPARRFCRDRLAVHGKTIQKGIASELAAECCAFTTVTHVYAASIRKTTRPRVTTTADPIERLAVTGLEGAIHVPSGKQQPPKKSIC